MKKKKFIKGISNDDFMERKSKTRAEVFYRNKKSEKVEIKKIINK